MSSLQFNSLSMNGINQADLTDLTFADGTQIDTTSSFAAQTDLDTANVAITSNAEAIEEKQDAISVGEGIGLSGAALSLDLSTLTTEQSLPVGLTIEKDGLYQLTVKPASQNGQDGAIQIQGARNASTSALKARLNFSNYDVDDGTNGSLHSFGELQATARDSVNNLGGLRFLSYVDGVTEAAAAAMTENGNWAFGSGFQDDYRLYVNGSIRTNNVSARNTTLFLGCSNNVAANASNSHSFLELTTTKAALAGDYVELRHSTTSSNTGTVGVLVETAQTTIKNDLFVDGYVKASNIVAQDSTLFLGSSSASPPTASNSHSFLELTTSKTALAGGYVELRHSTTSSNTGTVGVLVETAQTTIKNDLFVDGYVKASNISADNETIVIGNCGEAAAATPSNSKSWVELSGTKSVIAGGYVELRHSNTTSNTGTVGVKVESAQTTIRNNLLNEGGSVNFSGQNYIKRNMRTFTFEKSSLFGSTWGNGATQTVLEADRQIGESFCNVSLGIISMTSNGYYRIRVSANTQSDGYNNRVSFMTYLRIGATTYDFNQQDYNFFGWAYIRNNFDGGHGTHTYEDFIYMSSGMEIQIMNKLETGTNRDFNNTLPVANIDNYLTIQIERIYDTDPET